MGNKIHASRADLGASVLRLREPPRLPAFLCYIAAGHSLLLLFVTAGILKNARPENEFETSLLVFVGAYAGISLIVTVTGFAYRFRHRNDHTEVLQNGFCRVRRGIDSCHKWDEILYCTTFDAVYLGQKMPYLQVGLKNGNSFFMAVSRQLSGEDAVFAALALKRATLMFLDKTKAARVARMQSEFDAGGIVNCGGLKVSQEGIVVKRKKIAWPDIAKVEKFLVVVNVNGMKGSGHPVLRIYKRDKSRPYLVVDMCNVHNSDIVFPLIQSLTPNSGEGL